MTTPQKDDGWLEALFSQYHARLRAFARRRRPNDADDIVVDVFAAAWSHRADISGDPLAWLYRAAHNRILTLERTERRHYRLTSRLRTYVPALREMTTVVDIGHDQWVHCLFDHLSPQDAEVLRLAAWEELEPSEIARVLGCGQGAARTRLYRARARAQLFLKNCPCQINADCNLCAQRG